MKTVSVYNHLNGETHTLEVADEKAAATVVLFLNMEYDSSTFTIEVS